MESGGSSLFGAQHPKIVLPKGSHHAVTRVFRCFRACVVYLRMIDVDGNLHVSLVISKTKVAPIKRLSIPRLELCGAHLLAKLLRHCKEVFHVPIDNGLTAP